MITQRLPPAADAVGPRQVRKGQGPSSQAPAESFGDLVGRYTEDTHEPGAARTEVPPAQGAGHGRVEDVRAPEKASLDEDGGPTVPVNGGVVIVRLDIPDATHALHMVQQATTNTDHSNVGADSGGLEAVASVDVPEVAQGVRVGLTSTAFTPPMPANAGAAAGADTGNVTQAPVSRPQEGEPLPETARPAPDNAGPTVDLESAVADARVSSASGTSTTPGAGAAEAPATDADRTTTSQPDHVRVVGGSSRAEAHGAAHRPAEAPGTASAAGANRATSRRTAAALLERALGAKSDAPRTTHAVRTSQPSSGEGVLPGADQPGVREAAGGAAAPARSAGRAVERAAERIDATVAPVVESSGEATADTARHGASAPHARAIDSPRDVPAPAPAGAPSASPALASTPGSPALSADLPHPFLTPAADRGRADGTPAPQHDVPQQIVKAVRMQWRDGTGEARLRLQPEHLGEVVISLKVEGSAVTASLRAESAAAQAAIEANLAELRSALDEQGLRLARLAVDVDPEARRQAPRRESPPRRPLRQQRPDGATPQFEILV
jgi:flagellar hook-length control protein FliK